jgi:death-on-curing protein
VSEPIWIDVREALAIHERQISEHGGRTGVRDGGLLESALHRPRHLHHYSSATLPQLAAAYAAGIIENHPLHDGNKRAALVVALTFLQLNGLDLSAPLEEEYWMFHGVASGITTEQQLSAWIGNHAIKL